MLARKDRLRIAEQMLEIRAVQARMNVCAALWR